MNKANELLRECQVLLNEVHAGNIITEEDSELQYELQKKIQKFLDMNRPPTKKELVKVWKKLGYSFKETDEGDFYYGIEIVKEGKHKSHVIYLTKDCYTKLVITTLLGREEWSWDYFTFEEHDAVVLTIRYIKSLKENEHDNT